MTEAEKLALTYYNSHELGDQAAWFTACSKMAEEVIKARQTKGEGEKISQTSISPRPNPYIRLLKAVEGIVAHEFPVSIGFDSSRERWNELAEALESAYDDLVQKAVIATGKTHWEGCWKLHLPCALERVNQLEGTLNRIVIYTESLPKKGEENV